MRRADRLFEIVQLAQWLEVSERTIYRDIADLAASGVSIDGEAGVGYRLHPHFDLPPLLFNCRSASRNFPMSPAGASTIT